MKDDGFLDSVRQKLSARLEELDSLEKQNAQDRATVELDQTRVGRLSRMDALQGQAMAEAQQERRRLERLKIQAALQRIGDESYGECVRCGEEIAPERLMADPCTPVCIHCAGRS